MQQLRHRDQLTYYGTGCRTRKTAAIPTVQPLHLRRLLHIDINLDGLPSLIRRQICQHRPKSKRAVGSTLSIFAASESRIQVASRQHAGERSIAAIVVGIRTAPRTPVPYHARDLGRFMAVGRPMVSPQCKYGRTSHSLSPLGPLVSSL